MVFKQNKRTFSDDESCQLSYKQPRQLDFSRHLAPFVGISNGFPEKPHPSGEECLNKSQGGDRLVNYNIAELSVAGEKDIDSSGFSSVSSLSWVTSSSSEGDFRSEPALQISCSASLFEHDHPSRALTLSEDIYSIHFDFPPRKLVSIGPDHQADVPICALHNTMNYGNNGEKFMGTCIIPMPDADSSAPDGPKVGHGRTDCRCLDEGSIRCVRLHVMEAREKLRGMLGQERFVELGFCNMGEDVSEKWSEEDEQVFQEVVFSNPASLGKNFWDHLSMAFPSKTKNDLVSYYFNVFMLRRRAEQNRLDPMNIDSDNDEWQGSDDGDEFAVTEDDEDSVVESLPDQDGVYNDDSHEEDNHDDDDEHHHHHHHHHHDGVVDHHHHGMEDSCTSSDVAATQESQIETDHKRVYHDYRNDSFGAVVDHGYTLEPYDAKVWDVQFLTGPKKDVDFLPTCNVIQEVFGDEAWNNSESRNDLSVS
ncbi:uncharacterized protein LOC143849791 isoform X2 [Tasmannia lanceolata]|uniref:uncharacterized protein LOC143849791 isoform X2 n=1 Tax=Tasmannia lanceolata TaxID=3420 RepID=UPI004062C82B